MKKNWNLTHILEKNTIYSMFTLLCGTALFEKEIVSASYTEETAGSPGGVIIKQMKITLNDSTIKTQHTFKSGSKVYLSLYVKNREREEWTQGIVECLYVDKLTKKKENLYELILNNKTEKLKDVKTFNQGDTTAIANGIATKAGFSFTAVDAVSLIVNDPVGDGLTVLNQIGEVEGTYFNTYEGTIEKRKIVEDPYAYNFNNFILEQTSEMMQQKKDVVFVITSVIVSDKEEVVFEKSFKTEKELSVSIETDAQLTRVETTLNDYSCTYSIDSNTLTLNLTDITVDKTDNTLKIIGRKKTVGKTSKSNEDILYVENDLVKDSIEYPFKQQANPNSKIKAKARYNGFEVGSIVNLNNVRTLITKITVDLTEGLICNIEGVEV